MGIKCNRQLRIELSSTVGQGLREIEKDRRGGIQGNGDISGQNVHFFVCNYVILCLCACVRACINAQL